MASLRAATTLLRRGISPISPRGARGLAQKSSWQDAALASATQSIKGVGQVVFLDKPAQGNVVLAGLAYGDPALAVLAAVGGASATSAARLLDVDRGSVDAGLCSYNGVLVGCAFAAFLPGAVAPLAATVAGAAATAPLSAVLKRACGATPQFTLAFNAVALSALAYTKPFAVPPPPADAAIGFADVAATPLVGLSQIFVVDSPVTGAAIAVALAQADTSYATHAINGSVVGSVVGLAVGADPHEVVHGLWGFNSALTALSVAVFFEPSRASYALAGAGAASTAVLFGGLKTALGAFAVPALTLPFCAAAATCYALPAALGETGALRLK
ncbi:urea channel [Aureococcus anophagefferens]|uniref:Urea channel n=1 Tax=Aureococcus anophagefferens TaxID=44056 RepID=A0ABR1FME3_AURAN